LYFGFGPALVRQPHLQSTKEEGLTSYLLFILPFLNGLGQGLWIVDVNSEFDLFLSEHSESTDASTPHFQDPIILSKI